MSQESIKTINREVSGENIEELQGIKDGLRQILLKGGAEEKNYDFEIMWGDKLFEQSTKGTLMGAVNLDEWKGSTVLITICANKFKGRLRWGGKKYAIGVEIKEAGAIDKNKTRYFLPENIESSKKETIDKDGGKVIDNNISACLVDLAQVLLAKQAGALY